MNTCTCLRVILFTIAKKKIANWFHINTLILHSTLGKKNLQSQITKMEPYTTHIFKIHCSHKYIITTAKSTKRQETKFFKKI